MASKPKTKSYVALRNEPRMGVGSWTGNLVQGETLDLPEDVALALNADPTNPLVEEADNG